MTFTWPWMLWTLGLVPVLLVGLAASARRQRAAEARLADAHLLERLAGRPHPRRMWPLALYVVSITLLLVAAARPTAAIPLPVNRTAVVLAIDTSKSMMADDVKPTRLEAAKSAALQIVRALPRSVQVGLVAFSDVGAVLVTPTTDRRLLHEAMQRLEPQQSTAVGSAVVEGLAILPGRREFLGERLTRLRVQSAQDPFGLIPPAPPVQGPPLSAADLPPAAIVLLSDGVTNAGVDPQVPAVLALEGRVRVHTVGIGQQGGAVMQYGGGLILVPFDSASLQQLAQRTGGEYLNAVDEEGIRRIARHLARSMGWERRRTELSALLAGGAWLLMLGGAALSLLWFRRVP